MSDLQRPPSWRLPEGVNTSLWEYTHSERLAESEDEYFRNHPLLAADVGMLDAEFQAPGSLVDLGSGSGRLSLHFARRGFEVVAVDLSRPMLRVLRRKAINQGLLIQAIEANLCDLRFLPESRFAYALSMFSTLGMIRGCNARRKALAETFRILRPGGRLALHAHNLWLNLGNPQGRRWLLSEVWRALHERHPLGDRRMTYRGIPGMEVYLYQWSRLRGDLLSAGFAIDRVVPIDTLRARPIRAAWFLPRLRAGGWVHFARKPGCN
jgi:SAM-dependent methyltransferase